MRPAFLCDECRVRELTEEDLLRDHELADADPELLSVLNLNEPDDYTRARARAAPSVTVRRFGTLATVAPSLIVPSLGRPTREEAARFVEDTVRRGHEGVMVKALASRYAAGRRGQSWLKIKLARTLDLVVLAAEWGHGRRRGWLSNLHLGARDPGENAYLELRQARRADGRDERLEVFLRLLVLPEAPTVTARRGKSRAGPGYFLRGGASLTCLSNQASIS